MAAPQQPLPQTGPQGMPPQAPQPRARNWWEELLPKMPQMGIGNMLGFGLVLVLGYFFMRSEWGQKIIHGVIDMLPEGWKNNVSAFINGVFPGFAPDAANAIAEGMTAEQAREKMVGQGIPEEIARVIAPNDPAWKDFVGQVREAGGDIMNPISDKVIFQLMTKRPQLVQNILQAARNLPTGTQGAGETMAKIQSALLALVNDPVKLNTLLSGEHFAHTMTALESVCPIPFAPGALATFVQATGMEDGKATAGFQKFLTAMLSDSPTQRGIALLKFLGDADPAAVGQLFKDVNADTLQDPNLKALVKAAQNAQNRIALRDLGATLDEAQIESLLGALGQCTQNPRAILELLDANPQMRDAVVKFARGVDITTIPAEWRDGLTIARGGEGAITAVNRLTKSLNVEEWTRLITNDGQDVTPSALTQNFINTLMNPQKRAELVQGTNLFDIGQLLATYRDGMERGEAREGLEFLSVYTKGRDGRDKYVNLTSLHIFFDEIGKNANNGGEHSARTRTIMGGLGTFIVTSDRSVLADLNPADVVGFFGDPKNATAFGNLLNNVNTSTLPRQQQVMIREMRQHWPALRELLADPASVQFALDIIGGKRNLQPLRDDDLFKGVKEWAAWSGMDFGTSGLTPKMREKRADIEDMMRDLKAAGVTLDTGAAPAPARPGSGPALS